MAKTITESHILYKDHPDGQVELTYYPTSHAYKVDGRKPIGVSSVPDIIDKPGLRYYYMNEALDYVMRNLNHSMGKDWEGSIDKNEWDELVKEAKLAHKQKSDRGKENGTRVHAWLEEFLIAKRDGAKLPILPTEKKIEEDPQDWDEALQQDIDIEWNNLIEALSQFIHWYDNHEIEVVDLERIVYSRQYDFAGRFDAILRIDGKLYMVDFKTNNPTKEFPHGIYPEMFDQIAGYDIAYTEELYPDLHKENKSCFDGHAVFNFSKKSGMFRKLFNDDKDVRVNRAWFIHTLGTKRGQQYHVRKMSTLYKQNRSK